MDFFFSLLDSAKTILIQAAPGMPPDIWWVTAIVFALLALTAMLDAFTEVVPDKLIFLGLLAVTGMQGFYASWDIAAHHLREAIAAVFVIWVINFVWHKFFKNDALGMGDAKWTMLATACFGVIPVLIAWGVGACLAVAGIGIMALLKYKITQITFAPFLLIGLAAGLYWLRFVENVPAVFI